MKINTKTLTATLDNGKVLQFTSLALYHNFRGYSVILPGQGRNVISGTVMASWTSYNTVICLDCREVAPGIFDVVLPTSSLDSSGAILASPLSVGIDDAFCQALAHLGITEGELRLAQRFYSS